ncbi:hypothetical protein RSOLAG22IIIB_12176 [Rhizoctonia solani]|uniref:Uncharacterized protein n=1 Tax=Rhizoctonia solani TaxID=456999 RepID=A0A0K6GD02_9AGAM|nr:hypothetical protein RSOLAG22IIIB_12176 [Rhizoctonia solani]
MLCRNQKLTIVTAIEPCSLAWVHTEPDKNDLVDWYGVFSRSGPDDTVTCMQKVTYTGPRAHEGYEYRIERRLDNATVQRLINGTYGIHPWFKDESPSFWLGGEIMAPRISRPIQPEYGSYMSFKTQVTQRRFIVSSPLWDSITGSDPTYSTISYFSPSIIRRESLQVNDSEVTVQAAGLIYMPTYLETSEHAGRAVPKPGDNGPLCEITEDYRTTSTFDIFASIGGLLALLQGIHILLFGRPLFWGMFGTKLITPFGLTGRLATEGFKERLQERYYSPSQPQYQAAQWQQTTHGPRTAADMDITQFLLDFVVDMGPAAAPSPNREELNTESSDSEDDCQYKPVQHLEDVEKMGDVVQLEWKSVSECPSK